MATIESTTNTQQFKADTTTQAFEVLTTIATRYQRMEWLLMECQHDERNRLCMETYEKVLQLLSDLDEALL